MLLSLLVCMSLCLCPWAETWHQIWGEPKIFFAAQFQEKFQFSGYKFLMTFFLVIDLVLRIFPFFSHIFRMFTMLNVVYDHFLTRKTQFFTLFMLPPTTEKTPSQNIGGGGPMHGRSPHLKFLGGPSPQSPLGLRPWLDLLQKQFVIIIKIRLTLTKFIFV